MALIDPSMFKAYDIRGIIDQNLTLIAIKLIAKGYAKLAKDNDVKKVAIGRDGRLSSEKTAKAFANELIKVGINVIDIGMVTTPMLYYAAHVKTDGSAVMVTGSHNPKNHNGFKFMINNITLSKDEIQNILQIIQNDNFIDISDSAGNLEDLNIEDEYIDYIASNVKLLKPIKVTIDTGNGVAGSYAGKLYTKLGCEVRELFKEVDGNFPNHHPDPSKPENLTYLINDLKKTDNDIGLAFDGDADRLGVVTKDGHIIFPDRLLMLFAKHVLLEHPNQNVIFDVKCTGLLTDFIKKYQGNPIISKTGHSLIKKAMKDSNAILAGEMSGHIFFNDRWFGFDDGLYAGARLLEILSNYDDITSALNSLPNSISTPEINIKMDSSQEAHDIVEKIKQSANFDGSQKIVKIDGVRVEYKYGFGLLRASNTSPILVLRFEADTKEHLKMIQEIFINVLIDFNVISSVEDIDLNSYLL